MASAEAGERSCWSILQQGRVSSRPDSAGVHQHAIQLQQFIKTFNDRHGRLYLWPIPLYRSVFQPYCPNADVHRTFDINAPVVTDKNNLIRSKLEFFKTNVKRKRIGLRRNPRLTRNNDGFKAPLTDRNFDLLQSTREDPFLKGGAILAGMGAWLGEKCRPTHAKYAAIARLGHIVPMSIHFGAD